MSLKAGLLSVASVYADARKLSASRVSTIVFGDGKILARLEGNADITTGRFEQAMRWFSANWPDGAEWPENVARPSPAIEAAE